MQSDKLDQLLDTYGCLYKFHDQPITFLYNTFHYYEANLRDKSQHKRKLVYTIINAFKDVKPPNWAVTETFLNYCQKNNDDWKSGKTRVARNTVCELILNFRSRLLQAASGTAGGHSVLGIQVSLPDHRLSIQ